MVFLLHRPPTLARTAGRVRALTGRLATTLTAAGDSVLATSPPYRWDEVEASRHRDHDLAVDCGQLLGARPVVDLRAVPVAVPRWRV